LGFAGDKSVPYPTMSAVEVLSTGISNQDLRDEIYAQILKQLLNNKVDVSKKRLYKLLILCLNCFAPNHMENYIDYFLRKKSHNAKKLLFLLYQRVCITPCVTYSSDEIQTLVKNAKKADDMPEIDEYLPAYSAGTHPHLAIFKDRYSKKDQKTIKLH